MNSKTQKRLIEQAKTKIKHSITEEVLIIQGIRAYDEIIKTEKRLKKIAREWYSYEVPEAAEKSNFLRYITQRAELVLRDLKITDSLGKPLEKKSKIPLQRFSRLIYDISKTQDTLKTYIKHSMKKISQNLAETATPLIAARLLEKSGSLKQLAEFPSSTIQMLGAEKALFRHLKDPSSKSPKYGIIHSHPDVANSKQKGKAARQLAGKISIAVRKDYYKNANKKI